MTQKILFSLSSYLFSPVFNPSPILRSCCVISDGVANVRHEYFWKETNLVPCMEISCLKLFSTYLHKTIKIFLNMTGFNSTIHFSAVWLTFFFIISTFCWLSLNRINRIFNRSPMQTEKSQSEGKRILSETKFTEFPVISVDLRVWISLSASVTGVD